MTTHNPFEKLAEHYRAPADIARQFGELHSRDENVARSLLVQLQQIVGPNGTSRTGRRAGAEGAGRRETKVQLVESQFVHNGNKHLTKPQIMEATGISNSSLHTVLYTTGADSFDSKRNFDGKNSGFRLKPSRYAELTAGDSGQKGA